MASHTADAKQQDSEFRSLRYSQEQWEEQKSLIECLYLSEDRSLREVQAILATDYEFPTREKQLKSRLTKWGFDVKNIKSETMIELARTKAKRSKYENKESAFRVNKRPVDDRKIERHLQRAGYDEEDLLAMTSPANAPAWSVYTPRSPSQGRSPTPGLDFQSFSIADQLPKQRSDSTERDVGSQSPYPKFRPIESKEELRAYDEWSGRKSAVETRGSVRPDVDNYMDHWGKEWKLRHGDLKGSSDWPQAKLRNHVDQWWSDYLREYERVKAIASKERFQPTWKLLSIIPGSIIENFLDPPSQYDLDRVEPPHEAPRSLKKGFAWSCHQCGRQAGMTIIIDHCPECGHARCTACAVESFKHLDR